MAPKRESSLRWVKSSASGGGECVQVALAESDLVLVRDSKDPAGSVLTFDAREWDAFLAGAKAGEFDRCMIGTRISELDR